MDLTVSLLRLAGPPLLALAATAAVVAGTARRGLLPPGFARLGRFYAATGILALVLYLASFGALGVVGEAPELDLESIAVSELFLLHVTVLLALLAWYALGYGALPRRREPAAPTAMGVLSDVPADHAPEEPAPPPTPLARLSAECGLRLPASAEPARELLLGLALGVAAWIGVALVMLLLSTLLPRLGGGGLLPGEPPELVVWMAALPAAVRLALSLSAGLVEELFFRGFLQPRVGVTLSTVLFVLAHLSYQHPWMLVGVTLLSLIFAAITRWRRNVWPAIVAHTTFDAIQLLLVIPALEGMA